MKKEFIVLAVVIVLLAGVLLLRKNNNVHYTIPGLDPMEENSVTKLVIDRPNEEITLKRSGDRWEIEPEGFKADAKAISSMISRLSGLSISAMVSEGGHYNVYDLSDDKKITVQAFEGDSVIRGLDIGKQAASSRHTYILLAGDKKVYQADGDFRSTFDKERDSLRDKIVMAFDDDISGIEINFGKKNIVLKKAASATDANAPESQPGQATQKWISEDGKHVRDSAVNETINTLRNLTCQRYIDDKNTDDLGKPSYTMTLEGSKKYSIAVFDKTKDNSYPARSSESSYPFYLSQWKAKKIMLTGKALFEK
jgi:hypothetical protein